MTRGLPILFVAVAFSALAAEQATPSSRQDPAQSAVRQQEAPKAAVRQEEAAKPPARQQPRAAQQTQAPRVASDCPVGSNCYQTRKQLAEEKSRREADELRSREEALRRAGSGSSLCAADACG